MVLAKYLNPIYLRPKRSLVQIILNMFEIVGPDICPKRILKYRIGSITIQSLLAVVGK